MSLIEMNEIEYARLEELFNDYILTLNIAIQDYKISNNK